MTNSRNEQVRLSTSDKIHIGIGFVTLLVVLLGGFATMLGVFYTTTGNLERANAVQDIRLDAHDSEIARLRGK